MSDLYSRISEECKKTGINSNELGRLLSLKKGPLTDWKNQKSKPTLDQLIKMCEICAVSADYLLFGTTRKDLTQEECTLLEKYISLSSYDKEDIHAFIDFKLQRSSEVKTKFSLSENNSRANIS